MTAMTTHDPRRAALAQADRSARNQRLFILAAVGIEAALIAAFLLLADFGNRTHALLFVSTVAVYSTVGAGLFALAARIDQSNYRVIEALRLASKM
jgi:hypothetical protein